MRLLDRVPEKAKPALEHAINVSSRRHLKALRRLSLKRPELAARLSSEFAERRFMKAKEMIEKGRYRARDKRLNKGSQDCCKAYT